MTNKQSPQTSAATSSTAVSPFTSPTPGKAELVKTLSASSDEMDDHKTAQVAHVDQAVPATEITRAYASFTFAHSPVYLLFAPGIYSKIASRIQYRYKRSSSNREWEEPKLNVASNGEGEMQKVELEFKGEVEQEGDGGLWQLEMDLM